MEAMKLVACTCVIEGGLLTYNVHSRLFHNDTGVSVLSMCLLCHGKCMNVLTWEDFQCHLSQCLHQALQYGNPSTCKARVTCNNNKREWTKIHNVNIRYNIEGHNYNNTIQQLSPTSRLVWMLPAAVGVWGRRGACPLVVQAPPPLERSTRPTPLYSETRSGRPDKGQQSNLCVCVDTQRLIHWAFRNYWTAPQFKLALCTNMSQIIITTVNRHLKLDQ